MNFKQSSNINHRNVIQKIKINNLKKVETNKV